MAASAPALIREWDLLQDRVVPPLLTVGRHRPPRAWSIGTVEDAVAIAVAYHAESSKSTDDMQLYTSQQPGSYEVGFASSDLRCVPRASQSSCLVRHDRRWLADNEIAERVILTDPLDLVDLVTVRASGSPDSRADVDRAVDNLRSGGHLLVIEPSEKARMTIPAGLDEVDGTSAGRVYRKRVASWSEADRPAPDRVEGEDGSITLAAQRSQRELVSSHVRLAKSLARRFAHHGESSDDLEQVAMLALLKAAKRFDPEREIRFTTYATSTILGELKRHFRDKTWMLRVPRSLQELYLSVKQAREELSHTLAASPTPKQIADHLGSTEEAVLEAMRAGDDLRPASLDGGTRDEPATEIPVTDASFEQSLARLQVEQLLPGLDHRERLVLKRVYFDSCTQREVASELEVSQMQVSRMLAGALAKLRG